MSDREQLLHDVRAPLAKAKTIAKLLLEGLDDEELLPTLLQSLEELDEILKKL